MTKLIVSDERQKKSSEDTYIYDSRDINWSKSIIKLTMTNTWAAILFADDV